MTNQRILSGRQTAKFFLLVVFLSFFTHFLRYSYPAKVYWDENYHIASAQKYLNGVFFMEQHPPLGKLLIAAGEHLLQPNERTDQFIATDYAVDFDDDFSFAGYRLFPALLGWWTAPLLFLVLVLAIRHALFAFLFSLLYVFDNALIVHNRGAMLEGPLLFFTALSVLAFLLLREFKDNHRLFAAASVIFGVALAAAITTKLLALVLILLVPAFAVILIPDWRKVIRFGALFFLGFFAMFLTVWQIHFALGQRVVPQLAGNGYYKASQPYQEAIAQGRGGSLASLPTMLGDSLVYATIYNKGAPRLDFCKADENGSPWYLWPLGARAINYRWETADGRNYRYLYLQSNPIVWLCAFAGVLLGGALLVGSVVFDLRAGLHNRYLLFTFTGLYIAYMIAVGQIGRVMYLYHYFIPLFLSFIILAIAFMEIPRIGRLRMTERVRTAFLLIFAASIYVAYEFYRPLTDYEPLDDSQLQQRAITTSWGLDCAHCRRTNTLAVPCK